MAEKVIHQYSELRPKMTAAVPLPDEFVQRFPDAPTRQTEPVTDIIDSNKWHRDALMQWYETGGAGPPPI